MSDGIVLWLLLLTAFVSFNTALLLVEWGVLAKPPIEHVTVVPKTFEGLPPSPLK